MHIAPKKLIDEAFFSFFANHQIQFGKYSPPSALPLQDLATCLGSPELIKVGLIYK